MANNYSFREKYNRSIAISSLIFLTLHIPIFAIVAHQFQTEHWVALGLSSALIAVSAASFLTLPRSVFTLNVISVVGICFSGILIHLSRGMIEMHFHIFVLLGVLPLFGYLTPLLFAAGTAAAHHLGFFFLLPSSVFNYQASLEIVLLHATFVVAQTVLCLFIANKFKALIQAQSDFIPQLAEWAAGLRQSGTDIHSLSSDLSAQSQQQSTEVDVCQTSMESLTKTIHENESVAQLSFEYSQEAQSISHETHSKVQEMVAGLGALRDGTKKIQNLSDMVGQIHEKTELIDDIVFQTKLLSFNASIEAERAGEHGRGFAAVAQEVGILARVSGQSADEITKIVETAVKEAEKVSRENRLLVDSWQKNSEDSLKSVAKMSEFLVKLVNASERVTDASQTQRNDVEVMRRSVNDLSEVSEKTQSQVHELSSTSEEIASLARQIDSSLRQLIQTLGDKDKSAEKSADMNSETGRKAIEKKQIEKKAA